MPNWCENAVIIEPIPGRFTDSNDIQELLDKVKEMVKGPEDAPFLLHHVYKEEYFEPFSVSPELIRKGIIGTEEIPFSFQKIVPIPQEEILACKVLEKETPPLALQDRTSPIGLRTYHWGTKWSQTAVQEEHLSDMLRYNFDTAWAPPVEVFEALFKLFKDDDVSIQCYAYEPGAGFAGVWEGVHGEHVFLEASEEDLSSIAYDIFGYDMNDDDNDDDDF